MENAARTMKNIARVSNSYKFFVLIAENICVHPYEMKWYENTLCPNISNIVWDLRPKLDNR